MSTAQAPHPYILYSFRRCPYAIRCRMVLEYSRLPHQLVEISLNNKPQELLRLSHKERVTVPVLYSASNNYLCEESWEIMKWALEREGGQWDSCAWWVGAAPERQRQIEELRRDNDGHFKQDLDRYKYPSRYRAEWASADPHGERQFWRGARRRCSRLLSCYEQRLQAERYLTGARPSLGDIAVLSFVRQFAHVHPPTGAPQDHHYFAQNFPRLQAWLNDWSNNKIFLRIMDKNYTGHN